MDPTPQRNSKNSNAPLQPGPRTTAAFKTSSSRGREYVNNSRNIANRLNHKPGFATVINGNLLNLKAENPSMDSNLQTTQSINTFPASDNNTYPENNPLQPLVNPTNSTDVTTENSPPSCSDVVRRFLHWSLTRW